MSIRRDEVNLILTVNGQQSARTLQEMQNQARDLRRLLVKIPVDSAEFRQAAARLKELDTRMKEVKSTITATNATAGAGGGLMGRILGVAGGIGLFELARNAIGSLIRFGRDALREVDAGLKADAQVKQAIISTGAAAGRSFEQLKEQAEELQKVTLFGDEQTQQAQALLLTFKNIKGEIFDQTIPLVQDLSTAFGQDLKSSAIQVGKALEDPIRGVTALRRVGVTFTADQQAMIKSLVDTGRTADAQRIILKELETQVGGSARAAAEAGLGPYQLLQNRLGEVRESMGALIERGLRVLMPVFRATTGFLEELTESLLSGKKATGEYSTAVNITTTILTGLVKVGQFVFQVFKVLYDFVWKPLAILLVEDIIPGLASMGDGLSAVLERAKQLPGVGLVFRALSAAVGFFRDALNDVPSAFAGMRAAAFQAVENVKEFFTGLVRSAKIVALELAKALTLDTGARASLTAQISDLKAEEIAAKNAGKTIGQAYSEARDTALRESRVASAAEAKAAAEAETKARIIEDERLADAEAKAAADRRKKLFHAALEAVDIAAAKEEIAALKLKNDGIIRDETAFGNVMLGIQEQQLEARLAVYRRFGQDQTKEALDLQKKLLEIQEGRNVEKPAPLAALPGPALGTVSSQTAGAGVAGTLAGLSETEVLRDKFAALVDMEQQHELRLAEIRRNAATERLRILQEAGLFETEEYKKALADKTKADEDFNAKRLENERRTAELKREIEVASMSATADLFSVAAELLAQDEKARKRNAAAIKAFQSAQVITNGILEVQKIWQSVAGFGPAAPIVGGILTAVAVARTGIALAKIGNAKFAGGGYTGDGFGMAPDGTGHRPVGVVHANEWVSPPWMTQHPTYGPQIMALESVRQRGFAEGGFATTPTVNVAPDAASGSATSFAMQSVDAMVAEFRGFRDEVRGWQGRIRVAYTDIRDVGNEVAAVEADAAI